MGKRMPRHTATAATGQHRRKCVVRGYVPGAPGPATFA